MKTTLGFLALWIILFSVLIGIASTPAIPVVAASNNSAVFSACDQIKIFNRFVADEPLEKNRNMLEADVNRWLKANSGKIEVVKIETLAIGVAHSYLEIIVWYKQKAE